MKLIDAEIVKAYLKRAIFGADPKIDAWVDAMPAANAIPVEWLNDLIDDDEPRIGKAAAIVDREWETEKRRRGETGG